MLAEVPAAALHTEIRLAAARHPGRRIAGEFLTERGWVRFLTAGDERDPVYFSKEVKKR